MPTSCRGITAFADPRPSQDAVRALQYRAGLVGSASFCSRLARMISTLTLSRSLASAAAQSSLIVYVSALMDSPSVGGCAAAVWGGFSGREPIAEQATGHAPVAALRDAESSGRPHTPQGTHWEHRQRSRASGSAGRQTGATPLTLTFSERSGELTKMAQLFCSGFHLLP